MWAQRCKIVIWELFQEKVHSPLFLDRIKESSLFGFVILSLIKLIFRNWVGKEEAFKILEYIEEQTKREEKKKEKNKRQEKVRIEIAEAWDTIPFAQVIRGCMLVTQFFLENIFYYPHS